MELSKIVIRTYVGLRVVTFEEIVYCKGDGRYTRVFLNDGDSIISAKVLKQYEDILPAKYFIRIHKSCLINMKYVKGYDKHDGGNIIMVDNDLMPLARRRRKLFYKCLSKTFPVI